MLPTNKRLQLLIEAITSASLWEFETVLALVLPCVADMLAMFELKTDEELSRASIVRLVYCDVLASELLVTVLAGMVRESLPEGDALSISSHHLFHVRRSLTKIRGHAFQTRRSTAQECSRR